MTNEELQSAVNTLATLVSSCANLIGGMAEIAESHERDGKLRHHLCLSRKAADNLEEHARDLRRRCEQAQSNTAANQRPKA